MCVCVRVSTDYFRYWPKTRLTVFLLAGAKGHLSLHLCHQPDSCCLRHCALQGHSGHCTFTFKHCLSVASSISSKALAQDVHPCPTSGLPPVGLSCLTHSYSAGDAPCAAHARVSQLNLEKMLLPVWLQQKRDQQGLQHLTSNTTWSFVLPCPRCQQFEGCADRLQPSHNLLQPLQRQEEKRHPEPVYGVQRCCLRIGTSREPAAKFRFI